MKRRPSQLAQRAAQLDPPDRDAFLDHECAGDPMLRQEVEELMLLHQGGGASRPPVVILPGTERPPSGGQPAGDEPAEEGAGSGDVRPLVGMPGRPPGEILRGERVGPYRILDPLGRGGFGVVYRASRADDFKKQVAIKVIKKGMDSDELLARFRNERQILASLDHPFIAKMLDGGTLPDGRPFIVMDYIDGVAIDTYCRTQKLSVDQIIEIFLQVCSAVHYAHQNLVIHRDLGPRNILVTEDGTPKLLDFGIAKLINPELSALNEVYTAPMQRVMTARYASPEQARGSKITTSSDIYSLGVLLYELLTGRPPYRTKGRVLEETIRIISEHEPLRPSAAVLVPRETSLPEEGKESESAEPAAPIDPDRLRLARQLRGDIDTIVLTAMRKEPARRYPSVEHFAEDLRRHLDGRPIHARKTTLLYRAGKWALRNKVLASVLITGMFFAAALVASLVVFNYKLDIARDKAVAAQTQAEATSATLQEALEVLEKLKDLLIDFLSSAVPEEDADVTLGQALDHRAPQLIEQLNETNPQEKKVKAELQDVVGRIYLSMGQRSKAEPYLKDALRLRQELFGEKDLKTAESHIHVSRVLARQHEFDQAREHVKTALATIRELGAGDSELAARALVNLADLEPDRSERELLMQQGLDIYQRLYPPANARVLDTRQNLALEILGRGDLDRAEAILRELLVTRLSQPRPNLKEIILNRHNLAATLSRKLAFEEALKMFQQNFEDSRQLWGEEHSETVRSRMSIGVTLRLLGRWQESEASLRQTLAELRRLPDSQTDLVSITLQNLGANLIDQRRYAEAASLLQEAVDLRAEEEEAPHLLAESRCTLAVAALGSRKTGTAGALLAQCLPALHEQWHLGHPLEQLKLSWLCSRLADLQRIAGDATTEQAYQQSCVAANSSSIPEVAP